MVACGVLSSRCNKLAPSNFTIILSLSLSALCIVCAVNIYLFTLLFVHIQLIFISFERARIVVDFYIVLALMPIVIIYCAKMVSFLHDMVEIRQVLTTFISLPLKIYTFMTVIKISCFKKNPVGFNDFDEPQQNAKKALSFFLFTIQLP